MDKTNNKMEHQIEGNIASMKKNTEKQYLVDRGNYLKTDSPIVLHGPATFPSFIIL